MGTIFTEIIQGRESRYIIYEDEKHVVILDKYPIDYGHSLVITRRSLFSNSAKNWPNFS